MWHFFIFCLQTFRLEAYWRKLYSHRVGRFDWLRLDSPDGSGQGFSQLLQGAVGDGPSDESRWLLLLLRLLLGLLLLRLLLGLLLRLLLVA